MRNDIEAGLSEMLREREVNHSLRSLQTTENLIDFCSNDYLSLARSEKLMQDVKELANEIKHFSGSTGSRSISGNTAFAEELEKEIAAYHGAEAGLLFNSGYDANVGLFSSIAKRGDTIVCDELIHASIIDGCRLSYANRLRFTHNNVEDLERKLKLAKGNVFVAVESVYSMDGDMAPLKEIAELCNARGAALIVDEAHATGVFGQQGAGLVEHADIGNLVFARIHTFGKAMGCHGAIVIGSSTLRNYLINFARSFIFTTGLPMASLFSIKCAYRQLKQGNIKVEALHEKIAQFKIRLHITGTAYLIKSRSPIQSIVISGNEKTKRVAQHLQQHGFDVRAIVSPSVPVGKERLRVSLHLHNTMDEINGLTKQLNERLAS